MLKLLAKLFTFAAMKKIIPSKIQDAAKKNDQPNYLSGRGSQINTPNRFLNSRQVVEHTEGIDEWERSDESTTFVMSEAKTIVNKVDSPDVGMMYSMNPYAGCEHGCIYCYARNVHEYWGYSAGLDFERKIIVKQNAPQLLRKFLMNPNWVCEPLTLSGNTDCYQPCEKKFRLTRGMLEVCREFNQPVGMITKNAGMLRDMDILKEMAEKDLVSILVSITTLNETLRRQMEPRTTTAAQRLKLVENLSREGIRMGVMIGPVVPGLNDHEIPSILKAASGAGASFSAYTFVRLNGAVQVMFKDWLYKNFPDRADKVWHSIQDGHGGQVNDSRFGVRMRGEGNLAEIINQQFKKYTRMFELESGRLNLNTSLFMRPGQQLGLF